MAAYTKLQVNQGKHGPGISRGSEAERSGRRQSAYDYNKRFEPL